MLYLKNVFLPYPAPSAGAARSIHEAVASAYAKRYRVKVAVIATASDLGSVPSLFGKPTQYAKFLGAGAKTLLDARKAAELLATPGVLAIGFTVSFLAGLAAVAFMVRFLRTNSLNWFVAYRLLLAAAIVVAVAAGMLSP